MQLCGVVGGDAATRATLADRLAQYFEGQGRVARIRESASVDPPTDGSTTYQLGPDGSWTASGAATTVDAIIADLSPKYNVVLLEGFPEADVPQVVIGEADHQGPSVLTVADPELVDPAAVAEALAETEPYETLESLVAEVKQHEAADRAGAIATFTGRVRERDHDDDAPTTHLEFEKYEGIAEDRLAALEADLETRDGVIAVRLHHRTGVIDSGEDIVFVVVLAGHRDEAFRTCRDGIDRLKEEVPIFKKEITAEETFWVHDRA